MNAIEEFVFKKPHRVLHKFPHYFEIYDRHFARFRGKPVTVVEIGIGNGGSLQLWADYFGPAAKIIGVDIAECSAYVDKGHPQISWICGDQGSTEFLARLKVMIPAIDVLIDDGSHICRDQILTLAALYNSLTPDGVYLCEDLQTSYHDQFGGGYKSKSSMIEFLKDRVDELNGWAAEEKDSFLKTEFMRSTYSISFYTHAAVIEKRPMDGFLRSPVMEGQ